MLVDPQHRVAGYYDALDEAKREELLADLMKMETVDLVAIAQPFMDRLAGEIGLTSELDLVAAVQAAGDDDRLEAGLRYNFQGRKTGH